MAITNTKLRNDVAQSIFTSAGTNGDVITTMYFCNINNAFQTANVFVVKSGQVANVDLNQIYSNVAIQSGDTLVVDMEKLVLAPGDSIRANCTTSDKVLVTVSSLAV